MRRLPLEYRREPRLALAGGKDGLDLVRKILRKAANHLAPDGVLVGSPGSMGTQLPDELPEVRKIFADELARHGLAPRMDAAYAAELPDLPPLAKSA